MAEEIIFSRPADEISCIIGNLFSAITPPCDLRRSTDLVICGMTHAQNYGTLTVKSDCCIFTGEPGRSGCRIKRAMPGKEVQTWPIRSFCLATEQGSF